MLRKKTTLGITLAVLLALVFSTLALAGTVLDSDDVVVVGYGSANEAPLQVYAGGDSGKVTVTFTANNGNLPENQIAEGYINVPALYEIGESGVVTPSGSQTKYFTPQNFSHNNETLEFEIEIKAGSNAPAGPISFPVNFTRGNQVNLAPDFSAPLIHVEVVVLSGYNVDAFKRPVVMDGLNTIKGGSTVPLKFSVTDANGDYQNDTSKVAFFAFRVPCEGQEGETNDLTMEDTGGTILRYDFEDDQFIYNWKSPKESGVCYYVRVEYSGTSSDWAEFKTK